LMGLTLAVQFALSVEIFATAIMFGAMAMSSHWHSPRAKHVAGLDGCSWQLRVRVFSRLYS